MGMKPSLPIPAPAKAPINRSARSFAVRCVRKAPRCLIRSFSSFNVWNSSAFPVNIETANWKITIFNR